MNQEVLVAIKCRLEKMGF